MQDDGIGMFHMLTSVGTRNMGMQPLKPMLMFTQGTHIIDVEDKEKREVFVPIEEDGANLS